MPVWSEVTRVAPRIYGSARRRARPVVVFVLLIAGRSQLMRRAGIRFLAPFPTLTHRIRRLVGAPPPPVLEVELLASEPVAIAALPEQELPLPLLEPVQPPMRLGPNAALMRRRLDSALETISVRRV
jgi:hypothetical protein